MAAVVLRDTPKLPHRMRKHRSSSHSPDNQLSRQRPAPRIMRRVHRKARGETEGEDHVQMDEHEPSSGMAEARFPAGHFKGD